MKNIFLAILFCFFASTACFASETSKYSSSQPRGVDYSPVWQAWDVVEKEFVDPHSLDNRKLVIGMIKGLLVGTGDSHCTFFAKEEFDKFLASRVDGSVTAEVFKIRRRGDTYNIGYLKIKGFYEKTAEEIVEASQEFKRNNVRAVILDLRKNTGGRVGAAQAVCAAFIGPNQLILRKTGRKGTIDVFSVGDYLFRGLPAVCLIDHYSASASEVVAGALRDHRGIKLIGMRSYGKGSIQENKEIDAGVILITTYHWTTPNGHVVNGRGIEPDVQVLSSKSGSKYKSDGQLDRAIRELLDE